ncbi:DUF4468 domain-containing protein [Aureivirga sp. CE67]|uniref:DUF4468 domain-containing protein n=1 Tax=Aureivirga sp. CE67 TaxID=1788983 RepID=UPI0018CA92B3|nr:DUF4468 domain-containing protein [Aureivirga sp. CE67]
MKAVFTLLFSLVFFVSFGQTFELNPKTKKYEQKGEIVFENTPKEDLYKIATGWIKHGYKDLRHEVKKRNSEAGVIKIKGNYRTDLLVKKGMIGHNLTFTVSDNKISYIITDFEYFSTKSGRIKFESKKLPSKRKLIQEAKKNISAKLSMLKNE